MIYEQLDREKEKTSSESLTDEKFIERIGQTHLQVQKRLRVSQEKYKNEWHRIEKKFNVED